MSEIRLAADAEVANASPTGRALVVAGVALSVVTVDSVTVLTAGWLTGVTATYNVKALKH